MNARVLQALRGDWSWTGTRFAEILAVSPMGHMLVVDAQDAIHYLDPDVRQIVRLGSEEAAREYMADPEVEMVWRAQKLVDAGRIRLGPPGEGQVYTLTPDAMLSGDYAPENLVLMDLAELVSFAGQVAYQTRDLPDGAQIRLKVTD